MLLRAKIIHVMQTFVSLGSVYYFSQVVIRNVFQGISIDNLRWLSLWSVVIWLVIYATSSAAYHQVWMMWYSVNYQITLPLFWYMLGLTLVLLLEETSWKIKLFFALQIVLLSRFILQAHSMEFLYYLMHVSVFSLVFIDKIYVIIKKYFYIVIPMGMGIFYIAKHYQPEHSAILDYFLEGRISELYVKIMQEGAVLLRGYNRASASINELIIVIGVFGVGFLCYLLYMKYYQKRENCIHVRMSVYIILTSLFVLIPVYQFSGGLFAVITSTMVVNRLYYSASLFVLLAIIIYYFASMYRNKLRIANVLAVVVLVGTYVYSKHSDVLHHNYYKNIISIQNSFSERKIGFNLSSNQIEVIRQRLDKYEKSNDSGKKVMYYARADISFVIKYMYHENVYWEGRRANPNYDRIYYKNKDKHDYKHILFKTPKEFPSYKPYM